MTNGVKVEILGQEYELRSEASDDQLVRVASHLNQRLNEVLSTTNTSSALAAAVLAALNITNEFLKLRDQQEQKMQEIEGKAERLLKLIELQGI